MFAKPLMDLEWIKLHVHVSRHPVECMSVPPVDASLGLLDHFYSYSYNFNCKFRVTTGLFATYERRLTSYLEPPYKLGILADVWHI